MSLRTISGARKSRSIPSRMRDPGGTDGKDVPLERGWQRGQVPGRERGWWAASSASPPPLLSLEELVPHLEEDGEENRGADPDQPERPSLDRLLDEERGHDADCDPDHGGPSVPAADARLQD